MGKKQKQMSVKQIIKEIYKDMDDETKNELAKAEPDMFGGYSQFHFGAGIQIRNKYDLYAYGDPDDVSAGIINSLIERAKKEKS